VKGRDLVAGVPLTHELKSPEVCEALAEPVNAIAESVRMALERTPPELSAEVLSALPSDLTSPDHLHMHFCYVIKFR
jgi:actin-like ATPase involved in cell morphogenesis